MLFNSFPFLFVFLPATLIGFCACMRLGSQAACWWLTFASLAFYSYWELSFLPVLLVSATLNFIMARWMAAMSGSTRLRCLQMAIVTNLLGLAYYKYTGWATLPIGISFFTFTQIAFLVDCYRREAQECRFGHYMLFVSYFPHLVAGPVLHHAQMMPQFARIADRRDRKADAAIGLSIFIIGLSKKALLADTLAPMANVVFAHGASPALLDAWFGLLAYAFQLYFDFSGYSDMAIGLSRLFGIELPLNFNAPYKAHDISDFWRRWHMSLSRFLRDYIYIPLGGRQARYRNLMLTMLLGGLWHGAGWTFVAWGGLHGSYLLVYHWWQGRRAKPMPAWAAQMLTFICVLLAWVCFRAPDFNSAAGIYLALAGRNGLDLPNALTPDGMAGGLRLIDMGGPGVPTLVLAMLLARFAPTTQAIFFGPAPQLRWALACSALLFVALANLQAASEFLYFQF